MSCYITYNLDVAKEKSQLYKDLLKKFNNAERANIVYEKLITGNQNSETSFASWLSKNDDDISEREPTIEEFNDWIKDLNQQARVTKTFKTPGLVTTVQEHVELSEGFTFHLVQTMLEEGLSLNDLVNKNEKRIQKNNIFNKTLRKVIADMQEEVDYQKTEGNDYSRVEQIREELAKPENIEIFKNAYNAFTELNYGFKLNDIGFFNEYSEDNQLNDSIEQNEAKETRDSAFDKSAIEFNTKDAAPKAIKLIIASLPKINKDGTTPLSSLGTPQLVDYNQTFSYLLDNLAGLPADMEIFMDKLKEISNVKPELKKLIEIIDFGKEGYKPSKDESRRHAEMLLRTQFVNQFDKTRYTYSLNIIEEDGSIKVIDANIDRIQHIKVQQWESNFKMLQLENPEKYSEKGYKKLLEAYDNNTMTMKQFLESLGIESIDYKSLFKNNRHALAAIVEYGMSSYEKFLNIYKKTDPKTDVRNRFLDMAKQEALIDGSTTDLQHYNAENKLVYDISLNTYLSNMVKDFYHYTGNENKLKELYPEIFNNPYYSRSFLVGKILDSYGFGDGKMKIGIATGMDNKANGKSEDISKLNEKDLLFERIFALLNEGHFHFLRAADRKLENFFVFEESPRDILLIEDKAQAKTMMVDYLFDEVALMKSYETNNPEVIYSKRDELFQTRIFENKAGKSIYDVIPLEKLSGMTYEDMKANEKIKEFMDTFIEEIVQEETLFIGEQGLTNSDFSQITEQYGIQNPIERFVLNSFMLNIETAKLFAGDTALFKNADDFIKRMSMLNSTKEGTRTDAEMNQFIASLTNEFEEANGYTEGRSADNSQIKTITINDVESSIQEFSEEELNTLREEIGNISGYENINEADGFAFVTYDEMRIMKSRYGEWFTRDEDLYQRLATAKKENKEYRITEDDYHMILPDKSQYTGKLLNDLQHNVVAGRKFSFITLAPGMYKKGSVLEKLHNNMASQGVGMAFFTSAAKFGHTSPDGKNAHHSLYDNNGNYNIDLENNGKFDILDYKYLGNQLKINSIEKTQTTEGTQKRKLNLSNFYKNGVINEDVKDIVDEYNQLQTEKIKRAYNALTAKMGYEKGSDMVNRQKFVNNLLETGIEQGFTTNELLSIQTLLETPFFEGIVNRQKIENFVNAKLANKVIKQKRNGTALAQASNVGFEINVDNNLAKEADRHDLKSYRKSKDKTRLLPMEVAIPLPKKLIKYIESEYGKGLGKGISESDLQKFNEDIAKDNILFEETGKMTDLTKITMMVGFRIPTQGAASMEVAKVKYFLMPHIGGSIVVPKTIVAKTGSDFDIDKLNLYYPEYTVSGDKNSFIANKFAGELSVQAKRKILFTEDVDTDIYGITGSELNQVFIENILEADRDALEGDWARTLNRMYNDSLIDKPHTIRYISAPKIITYKSEVGDINYTEDSKGELVQIKNPLEILSDKQLSNKILENEIALTLHPSNWKELLTPLDKQNLFDKSNPNNKNTIVGMLRELTGETGKKNKISDLNKTSFNVKKMIEFLSGKAGVGQTAVHNTNHTLAQKAGLRMTGEFDFFGVSQKDGYIDLGNVVNEDGEIISELIDELLSAYVDIAKDPFVREIGAVQETANIILMMIRQGIGLNKIYTFMNQPIIKDYIKEDGLRKSISNTSGMMSNENLVKLVLSKFDMGINHFETMMSQGNQTSYDNFQLKDLKDGIKTKGANNQLQLKALDVFLLLKEQSKNFQAMIRSTSPDTQRFKSFSVLENQLNLREEVQNTMMFQNYEKMFNDFIGEFWNSKNDYKGKISQFMLTQHFKFKPQLDVLKKVFEDANSMNGQDAVEAQMFKIDNDFVLAILQEFGVFDQYSEGGNIMEELFEGKNSIPAGINKLKKYWKDNDFIENPALNNLLPILNDMSVPIHNVKPIQKKLTAIDKENIYQGMRDLYSYNDHISDITGIADFYGKFVTFALLQSGLNNSPYNITQFIPSEFYKSYVKQAIEKANISEKGLDYFAEVVEPGIFVLNNLAKLYKQDKFIQLEGYENPGLPYIVQFDKLKKKFYTRNKSDGKIRMQKGYSVRQIDPTPIIITKETKFSEPEKININC